MESPVEQPLLPSGSSIGDIYDDENWEPLIGPSASSGTAPLLPREVLFSIFDFVAPADLARCLRVSREWFLLASTSLYAHKTPHFRLEDHKAVASFVDGLENSERKDIYRGLPRRLRFGVGGDDVEETAIFAFARSVNRILHLCDRLSRVEIVGSGDSTERSWLYRPIGQSFVTKQRNFDITSVMLSTLSIGKISYEAVAAIATHYPGLNHLEFNNVEFDSTFPFKALSQSILNLRHLTLTQHNLTTEKLELLLSGCESLTTLHIMGNDLLDDNAAAVIAGFGDRLRKLVVQCHADWPSEKGLNIMFGSLHGLEHVEVSAMNPYEESNNLTDDVVATLAMSCPNLKHLRLQNLPSLTDSSVTALQTDNLLQLQDIYIIDCWGIDAAASRLLIRNHRQNRVVFVERGWYTRMGERMREKLSNPPAYLLAVAVMSNLFLVRWIFAAL